MSVELWLAFAAASVVMLMIPGPTVLIVVSYALGHGRRSAMATVAGVALGDFTAMTASMLGLGVLLSTSAALFTGLKWIGAAYLAYLGLKLWRAPVTTGDAPADDAAVRPWRMMLHTYAVTALNPKSIVFFVAFLPQFLDPGRPLVEQMAVMEATFLVLATLNATGYALLASAARRAVRAPAVQRTVNRVGGSLLMGAGLLTVAWKRTA
ncbi:LysE family translocator [Azospirillum sp. TSO35-2]|uniref:LysE family translocator n=1 Tax=Azospirillum sp. TSO35-2 TaxID=716796 RepID=UPI000D60F717|nr:LysE family translocator [Azospirillum sp. TSO35-2]PWC36029.1 lysine transporter LysE [Azospirillum sp. TSO35-2]